MAWQVAGDSARLTLLGSVHMAFPDVYPLREELETAFENADALVVEVDITGPGAAEIQRLLLDEGMLPAGQTVEHYLSTPVWHSLQAYMDRHALPGDSVVRMKPGLLATTLSALRLAEFGMQVEHGIDRHFLNRVQGDKPVLELESPAEQVALLLDFPDPDLLMAQTLLQLEDMEAIIAPVYEAWLEGDSTTLYQLLLAQERARHPEFEAIYQRFFDDRNHAMADRLTELLAGEGHYFVVVGAGHLVGEEGIIALLQRAGFTISRF
jgi:uncharacterized protein YbaP (TraB family)